MTKIVTVNTIRYKTNILRLNLFTKFNKNLIPINPLIAEAVTPAQNATFRSAACSFESFNTPAAIIIGVASKNENFAAASRDNPLKSPAVIVTPERDTPGITAIACAKPITNAVKVTKTQRRPRRETPRLGSPIILRICAAKPLGGSVHQSTRQRKVRIGSAKNDSCVFGDTDELKSSHEKSR